MEHEEKTGIIFNIQKFSVHDGPGIRTTVFMKGCPLQCHWCANAESMSPKPELGIIRSRCNNCKKCLDVCPEGAISFDDNHVIRFNRNRCTVCGECVTVCSTDALTIYGKQVTVDDVFKEVTKDRIFYEGSSGGLTVSGGEPLRQADFVTELFRRCREAGIDTCLDTCGYAPTEKLQEVLAFTNHVLYDLKHMDAGRHQYFTSVANGLILNNAKFVAETGLPVFYRIPLVKCVNDTADNITETAQFIKSLGNGSSVEFLPYHRLGIGKYETLDKPYPGESFQTPSGEEIEALKKIFEEYGVRCNLGG
jgi:pyruvate formate lyase activating enzyme